MGSELHQTHPTKYGEMEKANRYCAIAIVLLSLALLCYGIGVFLITPSSAIGIISFCLGLLCMVGSSFCFVLYARYSKIAESN